MNEKLLLRLSIIFINVFILFDLTNAPSIFIRLMNHVLYTFIYMFIVIYFDDILVYNKTLDEHIELLRYVLNILRKETLHANFKECTFYMQFFFL